MGWADYLSRAPSGKAPPISHFDASFSVAVRQHVRTFLPPCKQKSAHSDHISANEITPSHYSRSCQNDTHVPRITRVSVA